MRSVRFFATAACLLFACAVLAQNTEPPQKTPAGIDRFANRLGGKVRVRLQKGVQLKKAKVGDTVTAKLMQDIKVQGEMVVPKNSQLAGRVVEVTTREEGGGVTRLALIFERAILKDGKELPLYGVLRGLLNPVTESEDDAVGALQETKLRRAETEALLEDDEPQGVLSTSRTRRQTETAHLLRELYVTATRGQPTAASQQFNCREEQGWLWCGPAGSRLAAAPIEVEGMHGLFLQVEDTPNGRVGVLVSSKQNIEIKGGVDLIVQLIPRP